MLIEELWGQRPPRSARTTLQGYIVCLRKLVAAACHPDGGPPRPRSVLVTTPSGYRLDNGGGDVDFKRFVELADAGHLARQRDDTEGAAHHFGAALGCWRGPVLVDVQRGRHLDEVATRLEEERLNVLERRIDADLRLGRHHELLGELTTVVSRHTTHEGLHAHYMLALYRSGRRCEALAAYRRLHDNLHTAHGLQPTPALRRLHRSMLQQTQAVARTQSEPDLGIITHDPVPSGRGAGREPQVRDGLHRRGVLTELAGIPWDAADGSAGSWRPYPDTNDASA